MGWNSWDSYGTTIREQDVKANAAWEAAHLKRFGWQYVVIDMEWFVADPKAEGNAARSRKSMDGSGRYLPASNRFPSAADGRGFQPLADYVHGLGLKFGIHILQGIPKEAVEQNLPIAGASFHARDAADTAGTCKWNPDNYDLKPNAAGQAYYDSIARLYAGWGVDLIKVDCIAQPYKGDEVRMLSEAIGKTGRPMVLSLSPGPAPLDKVDPMRRYAAEWRISNDIWDLWHSPTEYPQGLGDQFPRVAQWTPLTETGHWPDADMLPLGHLGPAPGWGAPRATRLTHDEQRTMITLWAIFRSPLMMGGDLPHTDAWTEALLTNGEVLAVDQQSRDGRCVLLTSTAGVWTARAAKGSDTYVAVFNLQDAPQTLRYRWRDLGLSGAAHAVRDLWQGRELGSSRELEVRLPAHGSALLRIP